MPTGIYKRTEEHKRKISETMKGYIPWNKDLTKGTDERVAKNARNTSNARKGTYHSEDTKRKMSANHKGMSGKHFSDKAKQKMSKAKIGKHRSEETRKKISEALKGENNHNWQGGTSFEPYPVAFNRELKELIRQRDNYQCQKCGMPECENMRKLSIHHINYDKKNCLPSNLISLCNRCHINTNHNREYWINILLERGNKSVEFEMER